MSDAADRPACPREEFAWAMRAVRPARPHREVA
jgi:hypothetical protein